MDGFGINIGMNDTRPPKKRLMIGAYRGCRDIDAFAEYIIGLGDDLYNELKGIIRDSKFYDYLTALGLDLCAAELENCSQKAQTQDSAYFHSAAAEPSLTLQEVELFFDLLEAQVYSEDIRKEVRKFYKEKGPHAYLLWWKEHTHYYKHHNSKARDYMDKVEKFEFTGEDISSMRESFLKLKEMSVGFKKMFSGNFFLAKLGILGSDAQITTTHEDAYWHGELLDEPVPLGGVRTSKDTFIRRAFDEAEKQTKNLTEEMDKTAKTLMDKDKLYLGFNVRFLITFILCGVVSAVALARGYVLKDLFRQTVLERFALNSLEEYLYSLYRLFFVLFAGYGVWQLFRLKSSFRTIAVVKKLQDLSKAITREISEEKNRLDTTCQRLLKGKGTKIEIKDKGYDKLIEEYRDMEKKLEDKSSLERLVCHDILIMGLTIVCFWYLGRYSVMAMGESFSYYSVACLLITYLLFHMLLYYVEMALCDLVGMVFAKVAVSLLFVGYQVGMGLFYKMAGLFVPVRPGYIETGSKLLDIGAILTSRGSVMLIVTSLMGALLIAVTNAADELQYRSEGVYAAGTGASENYYKPERVKKGDIKIFILAALFMLADARMVAHLVHDISAIKIVIYLILGGVWTILYICFFADENEVMYGRRYQVSFCLFYVYYAVLALSGIAGFGLREVLFVLLQPLPMRLLFFIVRFV